MPVYNDTDEEVTVEKSDLSSNLLSDFIAGAIVGFSYGFTLGALVAGRPDIAAVGALVAIALTVWALSRRPRPASEQAPPIAQMQPMGESVCSSESTLVSDLSSVRNSEVLIKRKTDDSLCVRIVFLETTATSYDPLENELNSFEGLNTDNVTICFFNDTDGYGVNVS